MITDSFHTSDDRKNLLAGKKRKNQQVKYKEFLKKSKPNVAFTKRLRRLETLLKKYEDIEEKIALEVMDLGNIKREIITIIEEQKDNLFKGKQHLIIPTKEQNWRVSYTNNSHVVTNEDFSLEEYLKNYDEDTINFELSRSFIKALQHSKREKEALERLGVSIEFIPSYNFKSE